MILFVCITALLVASCTTVNAVVQGYVNSVCNVRNGYMATNGSCDMYIMCKDYKPNNELCPDGLSFDPTAPFDTYPCKFPAFVPCNGRISQKAKPTAECPHQYGFFEWSSGGKVDCTKYRQCVEGRATKMSCPAGFVFNPNNFKCDYPSSVPSCRGATEVGNLVDPVRPSSVRPPTRGSDGVCQIRNGYMAVQGRCDAYIKCNEYVATNEICPDGLNFDSTTRFNENPCKFPVDVPCKNGVSQPARPTAECPRQYGFFPVNSAARSDCGKYHLCREGRATIMNCPTGYAFNPKTSHCDYPENVPGCKAEPKPVVVPATPKTPTVIYPARETINKPPVPNSVCRESNGYVAVEGSCDSYIICNDYKPMNEMCPDGLHFDVNVKYPHRPCKYPTEVPCPSGIQQQPKPTADCPRQYGFFPLNSGGQVDCKRYRLCAEGRAVVKSCPAEFVFNPDNSRCDYPENVAHCKHFVSKQVVVADKPKEEIVKQPVVVHPETDPEPPVEISSKVCKQRNGYVPVEGSCDTYILCRGYVSSNEICPDGLNFDVNTKYPNNPCKFPVEAPCKSGLSQKPKPTAECPRQYGFFPRMKGNTASCRRYRLCEKGRATEKKCPSRYVFNPVTSFCDYPENVPGCNRKEETHPISPLVIPTGAPIVSPTYPPVSNPIIDYVNPTSEYPTIEKKPDPKPDIVYPIAIPTGAPTVPPTAKPIVRPTDTQSIKPAREPTPVNPTTFSPPWQTAPTVGPTYPTQVVAKEPTQDPIRPWNPDTAQVVKPPNNLIARPADPEITQPLTPRPVNQLHDYRCEEPNGFYAVPNHCDVYVECKNYTAVQKSCYDGLHYNPKIEWPDFPCSYPSEVKCEHGAAMNDPQPTSDCPRRYGKFAMANSDCSKYIECVAGRAIIRDCSAGLVFNAKLSTCDYEINVPECKLDMFRGFKCPASPMGETEFIYKYRYENSCRKFIACQEGSPRLLSCDAGLAFDEKSEKCVAAQSVSNCVN